MLTPEQKRVIAEQAAGDTRLNWGRVNPRRLGDLVSELSHRIESGTINTPTFSEYADALRREPHAERVFARDAALDALLERETELLSTLRLIEEMQGPEGVVSFAIAHHVEPADCIRLLEEDGRFIEPTRGHDLALGD